MSDDKNNAIDPRPSWTLRWWLERVLAISIALLLLRSSFTHLGNPYYFLSDVYEYKVLGIESGYWFSIFLPFAQLVAAAALIVRYWIRETYLFVALLFLSFVGIQAVTMARGLDISCGCFGASSSLKVGWVTISIAGGVALGAFIGHWLSRERGLAR